MPFTRALILLVYIVSCASLCLAENEVGLLTTIQQEESYQEKIISEYDTIYASYFMFKEDKNGLSFLNQLIRAAEDGKKVHLLLDGLGSSVSPQMIDHLTSKGIEVKHFNPPPWREGGSFLSFLRPLKLFQNINRRTHDKLVIGVSSHGDKPPAATVSSRNKGVEYDNFTDLGVFIRGEVANDAGEYLKEVWQGPEAISVTGKPYKNKLTLSPREQLAPYQNPPPTLEVPLFQGQATFLPNTVGNIHFSYLNLLLLDAKESILVSSPYVSPSQKLKARLLGSIKDRVSFRLITDSPITTDVPLAYSAFLNELPGLVSAGVEISEAPSNTQHAKAIVIDSKTAYVGTENWDARSDKLNRESGVVTTIPEIVRGVESSLEANFEQGRNLSSSGLWKERIKCSRTLGRMAAWIFRDYL